MSVLILIAETTATSRQFLPPPAINTILLILAGLVLAALVLRWILGSANPVSRHGGLWLIRGAILAILALLLFNPVRVDETPGPVQRPEIFYLLDASASMQMGNPRSRWDEVLGTIRAAGVEVGESPAVVKPFRFGQRLAAIEQPLEGAA